MTHSPAKCVEEAGEPVECDLCGAEDTYVDGTDDVYCTECGHSRTASVGRESAATSGGAWEAFFEERSNYDGFYGRGRVKFVGGFAGAY
jgi:hypothetical protein